MKTDMTTDSFPAKVLKVIEENHMLSPGCRVLVALSGGADSSALLHVLLELREELGITVCAAHLNHLLRDAESDGDENFVKEMCARLGVPLKVRRADVKSESLGQKKSVEETAREIRYHFLKEAASEFNADRIATAHTLSDSIETVLLNFTRGTGLKGLTGIPPVRGEIVRPLINCTREEVEAYCHERGISFVVDSTNLIPEHSRNKIRLEVVPVLRRINPSFYETAAGSMQTLKEDEEYLAALCRDYEDTQGKKALDICNLLSIQPALRRRVIQNFVKKYGLLFDRKRLILIEYLIRKGRGAVSISGGYAAKVKDGKLVIQPPFFKPHPVFQKLNIRGKTFFRSFLVLHAKIVQNSTQIFKNLDTNNALDCSKVKGSLILRSRLDGDKIRLQKRGGTKSLKKLFNEAKIPPEQRDNIPVIADEEGVVWVCGFGISERAAASDDAPEILTIEVEGDTNVK